MKFLTKLLFLALFTVSLASCNKDSSSAPTKMSALIDGKAWDSSIRVSLLQNGIFTITGTSLTGEVIAITINGVTTGTYNLSLLPPATQCAATYKASVTTSSSDIYVSESGKVVLTKIDQTAKLISGTFEFTLALPSSLTTIKSITQGQFNDLQYQ
jgi:hypothetical protein